VTKIYIYCLFEGADIFHGVYSSLKAVHRDALKLCNKGPTPVYIKLDDEFTRPSLTLLRNIFKGELDVKVQYMSSTQNATIIKTKLRE